MKTRTPKKTSDYEDRSKSKKVNRRRRRRRDAAISSYSSDSKTSPPSRKKSKKLPEKLPKKSEIGASKKKKTGRYRSPSVSASYSSSSGSFSRRTCSTCRSRSLSRSPELRQRGRKASLEVSSRARDMKDKERGRSRKRSRRLYSYSMSSSHSRSKSKGRDRRKEEKKQAKRGEDYEKDEGKIIQAYDDFDHRSNGDEGKREMESKSSVKKSGRVPPVQEEEEGLAGDVIPVGKNVDDFGGGGIDLVNEKGKDSGGTSVSKEESLELLLRLKALENFNKFRGAAILAKKKPENEQMMEAVFEGPQENGSAIAEAKVETVLERPQYNVQTVAEARDARFADATNLNSSLQTHFSSVVVTRATRPPRVRSVVRIPSRNELDDDTMISPVDASNKSATTIYNDSEVDIQSIESRRIKLANENSMKENEELAAGSSVLVINENKSEAVAQDKNGSQFEQKTFSRMHDGEMVQVSYKVYIPKKRSTLARRQLQR